MIAALYVQKGGCYFGLDDVDPWDITRDARLYPGPWPVIAHPPCQLWVNFAALNFKRWGGDHNRPGADGGCFAAALASVRRWGGALEHPASSKAWSAHDLTPPNAFGWTREAFGPGWVCEVAQSAYGHRARKLTWLYYVGDVAPPPLSWAKPEGTAQIGKFDRNRPTLQGRAASASPLAFRDMLLSLARGARSAVAA